MAERVWWVRAGGGRAVCPLCANELELADAGGCEMACHACRLVVEVREVVELPPLAAPNGAELS